MKKILSSKSGSKSFSGSYVLVFRLWESTQARIGALGIIDFQSGFYLYVGSAMGGRLFQRVHRHIKTSKDKKIHWHLDYLLKTAAHIISLEKFLLYPSEERWECELAKLIEHNSDGKIEGFGSSDCKCASHLFYFNPNNYFSLLQ
ncbi:MAG: GIY-YIG nuclease family protein [Promethearchaeota archaeon]